MGYVSNDVAHLTFWNVISEHLEYAELMSYLDRGNHPDDLKKASDT